MILERKQYGCGRANGVASLATTLTSTTQLHPEWCHLQVDVQDAFSSMDREALWNKLQALLPELALSQWHWLMGAPALLLPCAVKMRSLRYLDQGIPQGDPLSSWMFSLLLADCMKDTHALLAEQMGDEGFQMVSYIDDVVISSSPDHLDKVMEAFEIALRKRGLSLKRTKSQRYAPEHLHSFLAERLQAPFVYLLGCGLGAVWTAVADGSRGCA